MFRNAWYIKGKRKTVGHIESVEKRRKHLNVEYFLIDNLYLLFT